MASITSNYGLSKPLGSEAPDISVINDNMDTLDSELVVKTSNDIADATATKSTGWTTVLPVAVGEKVASVFEKFSTMAKNIRWIYKFLGTADISSIGDGTVTNALTTLNTAVGKKVNTADIVNNLTSTSTTQPLSANMGKTLNDALGTKAAQSALDSTNTTISTMNIKSVTRVAAQNTTGASGNINTTLANDGWTYVIAPFVSTNSNWRAYAWVAATGTWYIKIVDADTGNPVTNTSVLLRYLVLKIVTP